MTATITRQPTARELLGSQRWSAIYREPDMTDVVPIDVMPIGTKDNMLPKYCPHCTSDYQAVRSVDGLYLTCDRCCILLGRAPSVGVSLCYRRTK